MASANEKEESLSVSQESTPYKFQSGEQVICFHGLIMYQGKCLDRRFNMKQNSPEYRVHYSGWNKSWDEWIPEIRVLKHTPENVFFVEKQKELYEAGEADPKSKKTMLKRTTMVKRSYNKRETGTKGDTATGGNTSAITSSVAVSDAMQKHPRWNPVVGSKEEFLCALKMRIPDELKMLLVKDWQRDGKNVDEVPAKVSVEEILEEYLMEKKASATNTASKEASRTEVVNGIIDYFNALLSSQLLYKAERTQHATLMRNNPNTPPSRLYGAIHLLRLFVKLGDALVFSGLSKLSVQSVVSHLLDFLKFLRNNRFSYWNNDYTLFSEENLN